jgi:hypothetical protein
VSCGLVQSIMLRRARTGGVGGVCATGMMQKLLQNIGRQAVGGGGSDCSSCARSSRVRSAGSHHLQLQHHPQTLFDAAPSQRLAPPGSAVVGALVSGGKLRGNGRSAGQGGCKGRRDKGAEEVGCA